MQITHPVWESSWSRPLCATGAALSGQSSTVGPVVKPAIG